MSLGTVSSAIAASPGRWKVSFLFETTSFTGGVGTCGSRYGNRLRVFCIKVLLEIHGGGCEVITGTHCRYSVISNWSGEEILLVVEELCEQKRDILLLPLTTLVEDFLSSL